MKLPKRKHSSSVVGLSLADGQLRLTHVVRTKGGTEKVQAATAPLSLDILHPDAELVGREIRNQLDASGIRERRCVVALPARWIMSHTSKLPELSPEDAASFLQLEAENGFPVDVAQLQLARSYVRSSAGTYVTQLGVRREQVDQYARALRAAGFKPASFSLGLAALPGAIAPAGAGRITITVGTEGVTILASAAGGILSFRTCEAGIETEAGEQLINGSAVAREVRITLEQVPAELRPEVRQIFLTGEPTLVKQLAESLRDWAHAAGLVIERDPITADLAERLAEQLAARWLETGMTELEFLPPNPGRWTLLFRRYNSRRLASAGFAVGALALVAVLAFGWQQVRLWSLRSEWSGMQTEVTALDGIQARIREYRPFYDTSFRTLTIMKRVTECFPETGSVIARTVEIHTNSTVTISGTVRNIEALTRTLDQLRKAKEIKSLKVELIHGKTPAQFTFTFRWSSES